VSSAIPEQYQFYSTSAGVFAACVLRISAVHMCKTHRGVLASHRSRMVNSAFYGAMAEDPNLKNEFLQECIALERGMPN
jgi:GTP cyclohydrolase I